MAGCHFPEPVAGPAVLGLSLPRRRRGLGAAHLSPALLHIDRHPRPPPRRHTTLNRPPPGEAPDLVGRQDAFSARCTPGALWSSPGSVAASDDSFSLPSGPGLHNIGLRDASIEELVGGGAGEAEPPTPTVDALNDMLK